MEINLKTFKYKCLIDLTIFWLKSLITLNGSAIIALVAFSGNIVSNELEYPQGLNCVFLCYIGGLISSVLQLGAVYLLELFKFEQRKKTFINITFCSALIFAFFSVCSFCWGSYQAINVFSSLTAPSEIIKINES